MLKTNPLKFALYEIGKAVVNYVTAGVTDFLDSEFDIASMQLGGVSGDVIVNSTLNSAGTAAVGTGIYGGSWNYVLLASADGVASPMIDAQFGPTFSDPSGAGTGSGLTPDQMNNTQFDWPDMAEHALAMGGKDAAIEYALGRNPGDAFATGVVGTLSSDIYRSYVHQDPNLIGSGDGGVDKLGNNWVIGYGVNNWGRWWSSTEGPQAFYEEGGWLSRFMDVLPGMDPTSMLHDVWSVQYLNGACLGMSTCPTMMAPAFFVSTMALSSKYIPAYGLPGKGCRKIGRSPLLRCTIMQMQYVVALCPLLLIGCGGTSAIYPIGYTTDVAPPAEAADLQRIDEALEENGFVLTSQPNKRIRFSRDESAILLQILEMATSKLNRCWRPSGGRCVQITFTDRQTTGIELVGEPCHKYLEFMSTLKAKFGAEQSRLMFHKNPAIHDQVHGAELDRCRQAFWHYVARDCEMKSPEIVVNLPLRCSEFAYRRM